MPPCQVLRARSVVAARIIAHAAKCNNASLFARLPWPPSLCDRVFLLLRLFLALFSWPCFPGLGAWDHGFDNTSDAAATYPTAASGPIIPGIMAVIEIKDLAKSYRVYQKQEGLLASLRGIFHRRYRDVKAVRGIDLQVKQGEFVAFLGPNGAGKTTTLKLLSGVISPSSGSATVLGHVPWKRENAYRRRFALVMGQKNQLWWDLPAQESFRLHQQIYRIDPTAFQRTLQELTDLLSVGSLLQQPVRELSLGERMKMELTAALLHSPDVLFLDEPTIGLDVVAQHNIQQFLKYYQEKRQITILLTSHYMKDVAALCKRVVIITQGQIMHDGSLSDIVDRFSGHKVVTLQFADDQILTDLDQFGTVLEIQPPKARIQIERSQVPRALATILSRHTILDVVVEDPPLEQVIAEVFSQVDRQLAAEDKQRGELLSK
jgi:ABC-2 type transport system ATP-binding protein